MNTSIGANGPRRTVARVLGILCLLLFVGSVGGILYAGAKRPVLNWDMVDYMALALEWGEDDPEVVHRRTFEIAEAELPPKLYQNFTTGDAYRVAVRSDWKAFDANLGFHRGRFLYTLVVSALHGLGAPLTAATWYPNVLFWACTAVLVLAWALRHFSLAPASLLALGVLYSPPVIAIVPTSSPDALAMFLIALGLYLLVEFRAFRWGAAVVSLAMLARTDFFLVAFGVAAGLFLLVKRPLRPSNRFLVAWLVVTTAIYALVSWKARDPGWWAVFDTPFKRVTSFDQVTPFSLTHYVRVLAVEIASLHYIGYDRAPDGSWVRGSNFVLTYMAASVVGIVIAARSKLQELALHQAVLLGLVLATLGRYLLYPYFWDRYFVNLWVPVPLCLGAMAAILAARVRGAGATRGE